MVSRLPIFAMVIIAGLIAMALSTGAMASGDTPSRASGPQFELPTEAKQCVRPTDFMRRNHMEILLHKRDETMYKGIRTKRESLQNCIECHSKNDEEGIPIPVNAPGQFCEACHTYASVKLDCFECHRTTPEVTKKSAKLPDTPEHKNILVRLNPALPVGQLANDPFTGLRNNLARYVNGIDGDSTSPKGARP